MNHIGSIYFSLIFTLAAQAVWGQAPDSTKREAARDSLAYRTVVSDRINESEEMERAPSLSKLLKKAEESFEKKKYYAAMKYYGFALKADSLQVGALKGLGESAFKIAALDVAESAFKRMIDRGVSPSPNYFPKMWLAEVKFRKGDYSEAAELFNEIASLPQTPPVTDELKKQAAERFNLCLWAQGAGLDNPYIIKEGSFILLDTANVNTVFDSIQNKESYSEYVSNIQDGNLYFSAYRFDFKKDKANPKRKTIKVLKAAGAELPLGPNVKMAILDTVFNDTKRQHIAHFTFNESGDVVYYAQGDYVDNSAEIRFDLYRRKKLSADTWALPEKLDAVNFEGFTTTEPSVGRILGDQNETLFFVSDRPGTKGGRDIWHSSIIGDSLTVPMPLFDINTPGDDVTPFYHSASNTLFFSTDSLRTLGGFDVYKSRPMQGGQWSKAEHMGAPINGSANDVFFVLDKESKRGFFSSNRNGSTNYSEEGCCYDIYAVDFITQYRAIALHDLTHQSLPFTKISLKVKDKTVASDSTISSSYPFEVNLDTEYTVLGEKKGFVPASKIRKTPDELWASEIVDTLYLRPIVNLVASVYDSDTKKPINGATVTFFDLGAQDKKGNFVKSKGDGKTEVLPDTSNSKEYKIDFGHEYQVLAKKDGFTAKKSVADSSRIVSTVVRVDGGTDTVKLYLRQYHPIEDSLPITLFFDNDFPKRVRSTDPQLANVTDPFLLKMKRALAKNPKDTVYQDTILVDYQKTFVGYMRRKETYLKETSAGLRGQERKEAIDTMYQFFENEVRRNWDKFRFVSDQIDALLQAGDTITLTLKGFASPLSSSKYNKHLSRRRISSVYNHFMLWEGGIIFPQYREIFGTGQLKFEQEPNGDTESIRKGVSGDPADRRRSIYGVDAARYRKVQITRARVSKGSKEQKGFIVPSKG